MGHKDRKMKPIVDRFMLKVKKTDSCWLWTANKNKIGYGYFWMKVANRQLLAHRVSYELFVGSIPCGLLVCHKCDNPSCVNPNHLFIGTHLDNMNDMFNKNRQSTCKSRAGIQNGRARLSEDDVIQIRIIKNLKNIEIAAKFGVSPVTIEQIKNRRLWKHIK